MSDLLKYKKYDNQQQQNMRKSKRAKSCIFCRRSHVVCDEQRPCSRCIKRDIAHLCSSEEPSSSYSSSNSSTPILTPSLQNQNQNQDQHHWNQQEDSSNNVTKSLFFPPQSFVSENMGSEFSSINEFLSILEDPLDTVPNSTIQQPIQSNIPSPNTYTSYTTNNNINNNIDVEPNRNILTTTRPSSLQNMPLLTPFPFNPQGCSSNDNDNTTTAKEQFFITAADPAIEITPEEKLKLVINAKVEAGLLKPYNYGKGYTRLQEYMDRTMCPESRKRILQPLSSIRPAFRSIARSLKDVDLVLVEEAFERMLLSYDRVFTSMSMPACLWRRTGEIYRSNKEFASIVGYTVDDLRDGKFAIYELMSEESTVNYWEKYGSIAFDKGQKSVLTTCALKDRNQNNIECCFSFTIRRDRYNIPMCIVGNFIPVK